MPRLNLARSIPNDRLELSTLVNDNNNNNETNKDSSSSTTNQQPETLNENTDEHQFASSSSSASILQTHYYSTHHSPIPSPIYRPPSRSSISSNNNEENIIQNEEKIDDNTCQQQWTSTENQLLSVQLNFNENHSKTNISTSVDNNNDNYDLFPVPTQPVKKRRRTVNKIDKDPEKIPLRDLLFYNPPETIYQKENRESHEEQNGEQQKSAAPIKIKRRLSSRSNSVSSDRSNNSKPIIDEQMNKNNDDNDKNDNDIDNNDENKSQKGDEDVDDNGMETDAESTISSVHEEKPETNADGGSGGAGSGQVLTVDESGNIVFKNPELLSDDSKDSSLVKNTQQTSQIKMKSSTTYNSFRRRERTKNLWNTEETGIFYTALEIVGTDFTLMEAVFFKDRGRDRKQLKQKFKREEKINRAYIDEILYKSLQNRSKLKTFTNNNNNADETKTQNTSQPTISAIDEDKNTTNIDNSNVTAV